MSSRKSRQSLSSSSSGANDARTALIETCGTVLIEYRSEGKRLVREVKTRSRASPLQILYEAFLPTGYPESVSEDYLAYQIWDSLQAGNSSLTGILASRAILQGVGVGDETATATAAVINWMIRDGASMMGRILFTWFEGTNLDVNAKTWRFLADIINDCAFFLEILSPTLPKELFLPVVSTGGVMKAIVGVSGGASRTALTQHQARRHNIADVSAKDGSQETAVGLLSLLLGMYLTPLIESPTQVWLSFIVLTFLHLFFNYMAVRVVVLEKINRQRGSILIEEFVNCLEKGTDFQLSPKDVAKRERIFFLDPAHPYKIDLGVSLTRLMGDEINDSTVIETLMKKWEGERYLISLKRNRDLRVAFFADATSKDYFKAYFHCELINLTRRAVLSEYIINEASGPATVAKLYSDFEKKLESSGWNTKDFLMGPAEWRIRVEK